MGYQQTTPSAEPGALLRLQAAWRGDRNLAGQSRRERHTFRLLLRLPAAPGLSPHTWQVLKCRLGQGGAMLHPLCPLHLLKGEQVGAGRAPASRPGALGSGVH